MIAKQLDLVPGDFIHTLGDAHIYHNHFEPVDYNYRENRKQLPSLKIKDGVADLFSYRFEDFDIINYESHPRIRAEVSV